MKELEKIVENIQEKTKRHFCIIDDGEKSVVLINGSTEDIGRLFFGAFKENKDILEMVEACVQAYRMCDKISVKELKKILADSLEKAVDDIKKELN